MPAEDAPEIPVRAASLRDADTWVFDLDNTLYPASSNLFGQIDERMRGYIAAYLGLDLDEAYRVQKQYFRDYGTSLSGLMSLYGMDPGPFLEHVHEIDLEPVAPNPALDAALGRLPGRKLIFTNATTGHAQRVMDRIGVRHHFEAVFDIVDAGYQPKPQPDVYTAMVERHDIDPTSAVMVEDMARNLAPAAALGMVTVWVRTGSEWGREGADGGFIDHVTEDLASWLTEITDGVA